MTTPIVPSVTDELIAELDLCARSCCGVELEAVDVAALLSERAELKRDAARMEWLAEQFKTCTVDMSGNHPYYPNSLKLRTLRGPTFRLAIDAAMTP